MEDSSLTQLGRYRILTELGRGAMGIVYRAQDPMLDRTVAIKTIRLSGDAAERADYEARFFQEARAAGRLSHPAIITVHDVGREGDLAYMAMELLPGTDLRQRIRETRLPLREALELAAEIADGLGYAHEQGVVHRDIKPANIMLTQRGRAKIMDFGIARMQVSEVKTQTGVLLGTPKYMSPEQVAGRTVDHRSDIFSLGTVLYEMLTGRAPFGGADTAQLMYCIASQPHTPPGRLLPSLPAMLDLVLARALEKDPAARYQDAHALAMDLRSCLAALKDAPPVLPAGAEATQAIDLDATLPGDGRVSTQRLNPTLRTAATSSTTAGVTTGSTTTTLAPPTYWLLSRHFDATAARHRLQTLPRSVDLPTGALLRLWRDADLRPAAAIVAAALVLTLLLARV
ncbi:MAG TPA: serine/threonine-protein kinase [Solimonas sp.]|nr:serine/threonine-protein kinase [Solimonas sp.]